MKRKAAEALLDQEVLRRDREGYADFRKRKDRRSE
jgi:hypothetical protein